MVIKKILNIIKGWYYKIFNKEEYLAKNRIPVCKKCPNMTNTALGNTCKLCGCILDAKTRVKDEHCEINKW